MAKIFDKDLNYVCTDQELAAYDKSGSDLSLKVWLALHKDGLI